MTLLTLLTLTSLALMACATPTVDQMLRFLEQYNKVCYPSYQCMAHRLSVFFVSFVANKDWAYPRVIDIAKSINYSALDPNVIGRVDSKHYNCCGFVTLTDAMFMTVTNTIVGA